MAALVLNNGGGDKLDYYVDRSMSYQVTRCADSTRTVRATIQLRNGAPASGLPDYVTVRSDGRQTPPGQSRTFVNYYGTAGAKLTAASLDGQPVHVLTGQERSHPFVQADVEIRPGQTRTLVLELSEPRSAEAVTVPVQPLARPMAVRLSDRCP
jgi:hypothetical protein